MANNFETLRGIQNMLRGASCDISNLKEELLSAPPQQIEMLKQKTLDIVLAIETISNLHWQFTKER